MHKKLLWRLSKGVVSVGAATASLIGLTLQPLVAGAVNAESVTLGSTESRLDSGTAAGTVGNPFLGGSLTTDPHGRVYAAYTDKRDGTAVFVNRSSDYGGSYQATDLRIDRTSGAGTAAEIGTWTCTDGAGSVYVAFIDTREGDAKPFMAVSRDYGVTFGAAARIRSEERRVGKECRYR